MANTGTMVPHVPPQFFDNNGDPANGAKLFVYLPGTTTKTTTYTTSTISGGGEVANANPIVLDSSGRTAGIFLAAQSVKLVLAPSTDTDPPASPIWTRDNISSIPFYNVDNGLIASWFPAGSAVLNRWDTTDNTLSLQVPRQVVNLLSFNLDTSDGTFYSLPADTFSANGDTLVVEFDATYASATLSARLSFGGTNVDLGTGGATVYTIARYVITRRANTSVGVKAFVAQDAATNTSHTFISALDLAANAYSVDVKMASGTYTFRSARIAWYKGGSLQFDP